jgi:NAD(P)H-hydrate epimerase
MMIRPLSREESRSIDGLAAQCGLPTLVLMENAGRGAAEILSQRASRNQRIVIACGPGNNGGDGAVLARHCDAWGYRVCIAWFGKTGKITGDAAVQRRILNCSDIDQRDMPEVMHATELDAFFSDADWIVDALFGTGLTRPVDGVVHDVIEAMNRSGKPILALDLPSGLDADTGQPLGITVRATVTATFVASKLGFSIAGASAFTGPVHVVEIGVPRRLLEPFAAG